ncbi:MAG: hypothetical protein WA691_04025 [Thermoplasmata archaeon]
MSEIEPVLDVVALVLAILLALIGFAAAARYRDRRFAFVGVALTVLGLVSGVGLANVLWSGVIPGGHLGPTLAGLLIVSEALLYLSFVASRPWTPRTSGP